MSGTSGTISSETDRIERTVHIGAPPEKVWAALTRADLIGGWFGNSATIDLRIGGRLTVTWDLPDPAPEDDSCYGTFIGIVTELEQPLVFGFRWAQQRDTEPAPGTATDVRFTLEPVAGGTDLTVVETGFDELDVPDRIAARQGNVEGWTFELDELVEFLAPGTSGS
ncbi:hypothetical protein GIS00_10105 [Nakamurella sp. YIM 132087]|uniref:Activator of Hsp90 ATPase homologue 1/2-like C-terminal domain-containing protein n=1 Tax=Nakamurella alba TaxID=2665158 RepID=A0A7K1FJQ2_9ACTN|nr:SRPBCC domain-containing protein [Nakamurella alba]MTD14300.1 hypothetical protein [Nakamurella alba]